MAEFQPASRQRPEGSVTAEEVAEKTGYSVCQARSKLNKMVEDGKLRTERYITDRDRRATCYVAVVAE